MAPQLTRQRPRKRIGSTAGRYRPCAEAPEESGDGNWRPRGCGSEAIAVGRAGESSDSGRLPQQAWISGGSH